ncbi:MAG: hypothetical protein D6715_13850 [Calditrichaeota bacterium]|nr:MAG: hypothetical protein D6715_13850 [Calditrichota bacterium]
MLLPPGQGKLRELNTSYTRFHLLLQDLGENRFSGYLRLSFWGYEGVLIFDTGKIVQASSSEREVYLTGEQAVLRLVQKAQEPDGSLDVFGLSNEVALALALGIQARLYKSSQELAGKTITDLLEIMEVEALTGYMDLQFNQKRGLGTIYYLEGTPVESVIMSHTGRIASGSAVYSRFLELGGNIQFSAEIYQTRNPKTIQEEEAFLIPWQQPRYVQFWTAVLAYWDELMKSRLKRGDFFYALAQAMEQLKDDYSFFRLGEGEFQLTDGRLTVRALLSNKEFIQGMAQAVAHTLKPVPSRRLRKVDWKLVEKELARLAEQYGVKNERFQPGTWIQLILESRV